MIELNINPSLQRALVERATAANMNIHKYIRTILQEAVS